MTFSPEFLWHEKTTVSQVSVKYCLFSPLISFSISHDTKLKGRGVAEAGPGLFALFLCSKACYPEFEIKCFILMTIKNWLKTVIYTTKNKSLFKPTQSVSLCDYLLFCTQEICPQHRRKSQLLFVHLTLVGDSDLTAVPHPLNLESEYSNGRHPGKNHTTKPLQSVICALQRQLSYWLQKGCKTWVVTRICLLLAYTQFSQNDCKDMGEKGIKLWR